MATVSETELLQKTSEYVAFVREHFASTGKNSYKSNGFFVYIDNNDRITLEVERKS